MSSNNFTDAAEAPNEELIDRIGQLTRALHESMRELGLDKEVEQAAQAIPDARDRLAYIAKTTEAAADRALTAIERARPVHVELAEDAQALSARWDALSDEERAALTQSELGADTHRYLQTLPERTEAINEQLNEIMMAQDFQDLTGQVVGRLVDVIRRIESQLVGVLIEHMPEAAEYRGDSDRGEDDNGLLNGPQVNPEKQTDIVTDQRQVDDLLDELGF